MEVKITWETKAERYQITTTSAKVAAWTVGHVQHWTKYYRKGNTPYWATCILPGSKLDSEKFPTLEAARVAVERHIRNWFGKVEEATNLDQPETAYIVCLLDADIYESLTPTSDRDNPRPKAKAFPVPCFWCGQDTVLLSFAAGEEVSIEKGGAR